MVWEAFGGKYLECAAVCGNSLLQPRCSALPLPQSPERVPEVVLCHRPVQRHPIPLPFLQRFVIARNRFLQSRRSTLPLPQTLERVPKVVRKRQSNDMIDRVGVGGD